MPQPNQSDEGASVIPDEAYLRKLVKARMPFGKYKGVLLMDLPEDYVLWFARKGFPTGMLGHLLKSLYEIKLNGLESLFEPIRGSH